MGGTGPKHRQVEVLVFQIEVQREGVVRTVCLAEEHLVVLLRYATVTIKVNIYGITVSEITHQLGGQFLAEGSHIAFLCLALLVELKELISFTLTDGVASIVGPVGRHDSIFRQSQFFSHVAISLHQFVGTLDFGLFYYLVFRIGNRRGNLEAEVISYLVGILYGNLIAMVLHASIIDIGGAQGRRCQDHRLVVDKDILSVLVEVVEVDADAVFPQTHVETIVLFHGSLPCNIRRS